MSSTAIVTGASQGIGRAITAHLIDEGWRIINLDLQPPAGTSDPAEHWVEVNLADTKALQQLLERLTAQYSITGLVNNAAIGRMSLLEETTPEDFDLSVAVNMRAPMLCAQAVMPAMRRHGFGRIVNISSRAHLGKTHRTSYAGTKGALVSMTKVWALEYAGDGVTCNAIAPGPVQTELFDRANPTDMPRTRQIIDGIPVGRLGQPDDIANAVAFFMDHKAGYITGQVLYVCGGVSLARAGS